VKANVFYYVTTGGILSFYFSHPEEHLAKYALALPALMSAALGVLFLVGASMIQVTRNEVFNIRDRLKLETAPDLGVLSMFLWSFGFIFIAVSLAILWILVR
jgi:hypothetical protein